MIIMNLDNDGPQTRNALMFPPDADAKPYASSSNATGKGDPKIIKYGNTRLPEQEESVGGSGLSEPPSPTRSRIVAAIAGTPCESILEPKPGCQSQPVLQIDRARQQSTTILYYRQCRHPLLNSSDPLRSKS